MRVFSEGPIVYINDDEDDQLLVEQAMLELGFRHQLRLFTTGLDALTYLRTTTESPLLILSDINMPRMNGLELRQQIEEDDTLRQRFIPFLFYTTQAGPDITRQAYQYTSQGLLTKEVTYRDFKDQLKVIVTYWQSCLRPTGSFVG